MQMTTWYGGNGWGWCSTIAHIPTMVILWVGVFTAMALAVGVAIRQQNHPPAPTGTGSVRPQGTAAPRVSRNDADTDEFWRRLM
jgi:hypothetical protein